MRGIISVVKDTYGFIKGDDGGMRFFIPSSIADRDMVFDELQPGTLVEFDSEDHERGPRAAKVRRVASR